MQLASTPVNKRALKPFPWGKDAVAGNLLQIRRFDGKGREKVTLLYINWRFFGGKKRCKNATVAL